jgi:hypothetical protein
MRPFLRLPLPINFTKYCPSVAVNRPFIAGDKRRLSQRVAGLLLYLAHAAPQSGNATVYPRVHPTLKCYTIPSALRTTLQTFAPQRNHLPALFTCSVLRCLLLECWNRFVDEEVCQVDSRIWLPIYRMKRSLSAVTEVH